MRSEDQVCLLEQAIKLKGLGVFCKSNFFFHPDDEVLLWLNRDDLGDKNNKNHIPAYTVAELGILLGKYQVVKTINQETVDDIWAIINEYHQTIHYLSLDIDNRGENIARAEALIWLIEDDYIIPTDLKLV